MKQACSNCAYLDKSKKRQNGSAYQYGCRSKLANKDGFIRCYIKNDDLLDDLVCGYDFYPMKYEQMDIFDFIGGVKNETDRRPNKFYKARSM